MKKVLFSLLLVSLIAGTVEAQRPDTKKRKRAKRAKGAHRNETTQANTAIFTTTNA